MQGAQEDFAGLVDALDAPESPESMDAELDRKLEEAYFPLLPYWSEEIGSHIVDRFEDHLNWINDSAYGQVLRQSLAAYFNCEDDQMVTSTRSRFSGEDSEIMSTDVANVRNLVRQKKTLISADKLNFAPQAVNGDADALRQVSVAKHLLAYVIDQKDLGQGMRTTLEAALVVAAGYTVVGWDAYAGDPTGRVNPVTGKPIYTGDIEWHSLTPYDVCHENVRDYKEANWHIWRIPENRYDLIARLRDGGDLETAKKLLEHDSEDADYRMMDPFRMLDEERDRGDMVPVLTFCHDRTAALPEGRMTQVTAEGLVLLDGPLPYPSAPIERLCPSTFLGTSIPFSETWSLLALADNCNAVLSPILSRIDHSGHPILSVPSAEDWGTDGFDGYRIHQQSPDGKVPHLVDLMAIPDALPNTYSLLLGELSRLAGVDSVSQGAPSKDITSGTMAALVQAQSIRFASDEEAQWVRSCERVALLCLQIYQSRADDQFLIAVAGKQGEPGFVEFSADSIKAIKSVTIQRSNPLLRTTGARQDAAAQLLATGLLTPIQYFNILNTGDIESLYQEATAQEAVIREENAMILQGKVPEVGLYEPFSQHIREHKALEDEFSKSNPAVKAALQQHIEDTMMRWQEYSIESPQLLAAIGEQPLPPPPQVAQAMAQQGQAPAPSGPGGPPKGQGPPQKPPQKPRGIDNKHKQAGPADAPDQPEPAEPTRG